MLFPPSPRSHTHSVISPADSSVKLTVSGAWPDVGDALKLAMGPGDAKLIATQELTLPLGSVCPIIAQVKSRYP